MALDTRSAASSWRTHTSPRRLTLLEHATDHRPLNQATPALQNLCLWHTTSDIEEWSVFPCMVVSSNDFGCRCSCRSSRGLGVHDGEAGTHSAKTAPVFSASNILKAAFTFSLRKSISGPGSMGAGSAGADAAAAAAGFADAGLGGMSKST